MDKERISAALDRAILTTADADGQAAGLNRSELIKRALQNEHLRMSLELYTADTVSTLGIDAYAEMVYQANLASGL